MSLKLWVVVIASIAVLPFAWYPMHLMFLQFQSAGSNMISTYGTNSTLSDNIELFYTNLDFYLLFLAMIGVAIFAWNVSQKKGVPMYEPE